MNIHEIQPLAKAVLIENLSTKFQVGTVVTIHLPDNWKGTLEIADSLSKYGLDRVTVYVSKDGGPMQHCYLKRLKILSPSPQLELFDETT